MRCTVFSERITLNRPNVEGTRTNPFATPTFASVTVYLFVEKFIDSYNLVLFVVETLSSVNTPKLVFEI